MTTLDRERRTPLHYAAMEDDIAAVSRLLAEGADPNAADRAGLTPLHFAALYRAVAAAELLLAAGAEIEARDRYGNTPLFRAVSTSRGEGDMIEALRQHGADPYRKSNYGRSPVSLARNIGNYPVAQFFADLPDE